MCRKIFGGLSYHYFDGAALPRDLECGAFSLDPASFRKKLDRMGAMRFHDSPKVKRGDCDGEVIGHVLYRSPAASDDIDCLLAFYPDLLYRRGLFFQVETASHQPVGTAIKLSETLPVEGGQIAPGTYIVVSRTDGVAEISSAGFDMRHGRYVACPGPRLPIDPALLVQFVRLVA